MEEYLEILREAFPTVYPDGQPYCGYSAPQGWFPIVWWLSRQLHAYNLTVPSPDEHVVCHQAKEKFATLRFYVGACPEELHEVIGTAEAASAVTCEECGDLGEREQIGTWWLRTLCRSCLSVEIARRRARTA